MFPILGDRQSLQANFTTWNDIVTVPSQKTMGRRPLRALPGRSSRDSAAPTNSYSSGGRIMSLDPTKWIKYEELTQPVQT
ncbi:MAG: hypothetical protein L0099_10265, partial [Acidobacteria bacterium]|nr:hypothetical protein [Acidobacteriota bacterium]